MIRPSRKENFILKQQVAFSIHRKNDAKQKILEQMGVVDSQKSKKKKLTQTHQALFKKSQKEMNHNHTPHPMAL